MNRKERRALGKQPGGQPQPGVRVSPALPVLAEASHQQRLGKPDQAAKLYKRALAIEPDNAEALNAYACLLLELGQPEEASERFARSISLIPEVFEQYPNVLKTLQSVNPALRQAMERAMQAWPRLLAVGELFGPGGIIAVARDPLFRAMLELASVRDLGLEYVVTSMRAALLDMAAAAGASGRVDESLLPFHCALARQCFVNEYVFAITPDEVDKAERLRAKLDDALAANAPVSPLWLVAVAAYGPLGVSKNAASLASRKWPAPLRAVITQQIDEPREERELAASIPVLTPIDDEVSQKVRQQYEENPYPRWVGAATRRNKIALQDYLRADFRTGFRDLWSGKVIDMLIAGCGTGRQSIETACLFHNVKVLAVDLSLASLAYAVRKTREVGVPNIEYAQADILNLGMIGRTFDVISCGGVLHHMADPMQGWRVLLSLLRPGGLMQLAFYSEIGRRNVVAARAIIAERGFQATPEGIRSCRRELTLSPARGITRIFDFFTTSECRDLVFHVQEHRLGIPDIKAFLTANGLEFIGFRLPGEIRQSYAARFPDDRTMTNLDHWHAFETANPETFTGMYQFWVQRT